MLCSSYGPCQSLAPFRYEKMALLWILADGGRYPAISILRDVLNRLCSGFRRVTQTVGNIFYLSIGIVSNNHPSRAFLSNIQFYIGKQQTSVSGFVSPPDIKQFKQHLTQIGHNLKGLYFYPSKPSSLPGQYIVSLQLHTFSRNQPPQEHPPSVATVRLLF